MSWNNKPPTLKERLGKLEDELDRLISIQEATRHHARLEAEASVEGKQTQNLRSQRCSCTNNMSCTRTLVCARRTTSHCIQEAPLPLANITKCLQHINFNLTKGTQAITKIAKSTAQQNVFENKIPYHEGCFKESEQLPEFSAVLKTSTVKKINEDALFKELREEKDKRHRTETQIKALKEELKKTQLELKEKTDSVLLLQKEVKETFEKLEDAKVVIEKYNQERQCSEYAWPIKFNSICQDLQEEQLKRKEAEKSVQRMQDMLQKMQVDLEGQFTMEATIDWLKDQNKKLMSLTDKLQSEVDEMSAEGLKKDEMMEENLRRMKQLACLCERLRDQLIVSREKTAAGEEKIKMSGVRCQRLTDKFLETQCALEDLKKCQVQDKQEMLKLSELLNSASVSNTALQERVDEMSEIMKQQNDVISQQSDAINEKEQQLKLAYSNIKLQSQRLDDLERKRSSEPKDLEAKQLLEDDMKKLRIELEKEKENILIKEKIIESHLETITMLKNNLAGKEEELGLRKREILESERKLAIEQTRNEQLMSKIKYLQSRKEELKQKVEELEDEMEARLSSEHARKLELIEKQVREKQKEWEGQRLQLVQEREEALESLSGHLRIFSISTMDRFVGTHSNLNSILRMEVA
ncbi:hypothetical protein J6590_084703 [Homalodisca vitripennis]|nr:hypothetical protein J6590_084703 [Homalodisca vitripennis]